MSLSAPDPRQLERTYARNIQVLIGRGLLPSPALWKELPAARRETDEEEIIVTFINPGQPGFNLRTKNGSWGCEDSAARREAVARWVAELRPEESGVLLIVLGFGAGYGCEALLQRLGPSSRLLVVVPDPLFFRTVLQYRDLRRLLQDSRIDFRFADPADTLTLSRLAAGIPLDRIRAMRSSTHPDYRDRSLPLAARLLQETASTLGGLVLSQNTLRLEGPKYVSQTIQNLPWILAAANLNDLRQVPGVQDVLVVGAGPSLDHSLPFVRKFAECIPLVAVDLAVPALLQAGIHPHLVVALDPGEEPLKAVSGLDPAQTGLVLDSAVHPGFSAQPAAFRVAVLPKQLGEVLRLNLPGALPLSWERNLGFVGGAAALVARAMGARRLFLVGMDFAYSVEGATHAAGSSALSSPADPASAPSLAPDPATLPGWVAETLPTRVQFVSHLASFERWLKATPDLSCVVVCGDGARIDGAVREDPQAAMRYVAESPRADWRGRLLQHLGAQARQLPAAERQARLAEFARGFHFLREGLRGAGLAEAQQIIVSPETMALFSLLSPAFMDALAELISEQRLKRPGLDLIRQRLEELAPLLQEYGPPL